MTVRQWLLIAPLVLTLALAGAPMAAGQSTPTGEAGAGTCIPEGGIPQQDSYLIGMSQANEGEPWRQAMNDQIAAAAATHPELEVVFADAAQNNAKQVADVENFLQQGIDLLIISPNEAAPLTDVVAKAYDQGIPVIVLDRKVNGEKFTMFIGGDNVLIGRTAGERAAAYCQERTLDPCNVLEIRGLEGATPAKERGDGFREGIAANPNVEIVASQNADWLREKAVSVSQAMLQANPNVDVVYAHNDPMAEGAYLAAKSAGREKEMKFIGIDALPNEGVMWVHKGELTATFLYATPGAEGLRQALKHLAGEKVPKTMTLDTMQVTKENSADILKAHRLI